MPQHNYFRYIVTPGCMESTVAGIIIMVYPAELVHFLESKMAGRHRSHRVASGQEEWQMARSWLSSLGVLPDLHRASYPNATVFDLAQCLRDGVLLCQVANRLRPNSVPDINMKPQMSPVCSFAFFPIAFP